MRKRKRSKVLVSVLAAAMLISGIYIPAEAQSEQETKAEMFSGTAADLLADFDFENLTDGQEIVTDTAKASGGYTLTDSYEGSGKAIHLDGSDSQWLNLTGADGSSLLTGLEELTVSYDIKNERTGTNWAFYAAADTKGQTSPGEDYIGILHKDGTVTAERYHDVSSRPANPETAVDDGWNHIDVVFSASDTAVYVNGVEKARVSSEYALTDILEDSSILQIGKANWGSGEYTQASMDNLKIYKKALSAEEIGQNVPEIFIDQAVSSIENSIKDVVIDSPEMKLPDYDGTVTWRSDMPEILIGEDGVTAQAQQPEAGEEDLSGVLTAVITVAGKQKEVSVPVTVRAKLNPDDPYGYLMVHFIQDEWNYKERIYLDISRGDNPEQWDPLNGGEPILASNLGTTGSRDPYLTYNPETETYYIIATDLRVYGGDNAGWSEWQKSYSTKMNVWESKDLIHWSDVRQFDVALDQEGSKVAELGMMWAPEATWVPDYYGEGQGAFVVYWSSQVYSDPEHNGPSHAQILWGATTDFTQETYEYGGIFIDPGEARIDTTIIQNEGRTYHITKKEGQNKLYMEYTDDKEWWLPEAQWTLVQDNIGADRYGSLEGPAAFKDHSQENRFYLFVDNYTEYKPMVSSDLDKGWEHLDSSDYYLTPNTKHGGVISLTKAQYDALRAADAESAVKEDLGSVTVQAGSTAEDLQALLPAQAEVNLYYDMGTSMLPVEWDLSAVDLNQEGTYQATGIVQSISSNKDAWVGKDGSTAYDAPDRELYSSRAIQVTAQVEVTAEEKPEAVLTGIEIVSGPDKTEYRQGEELDLTGLTVEAHYSDGSTVTLQAGEDGYSVSGYDPQQTGEQTITVSYKEETAEFTVTVAEKEEPTVTPEPTEKPDSTDTPEPTQKPTGQPEKTPTAAPSKPGQQPAGNPGQGTSSAPTGDSSDLAGTAAALAAALCFIGAAAAVRKKRNS